ncbi:hypothetical protein SBRY_20958 [Actinacidiphila bryophytorum]|uniref:Uncharacterized protein n=1 Tax=Actinacidiphila bryophytorum TaxID=1436133 RepID=A0A9W4GYM7_9ACTN|nr:hypothetical protein SBRY_20958 [Actinacidiphila bryophytorum]
MYPKAVLNLKRSSRVSDWHNKTVTLFPAPLPHSPNQA